MLLCVLCLLFCFFRQISVNLFRRLCGYGSRLLAKIGPRITRKVSFVFDRRMLVVGVGWCHSSSSRNSSRYPQSTAINVSKTITESPARKHRAVV